MRQSGPGFETTAELWQSNPKHVKRFCDQHIVQFLNIEPGAVCLDVGERNPRMEYLRSVMNLNVHQLNSQDLNFDYIPCNQGYNAVFVFEVIEHLQNPLWFMRQIKTVLRHNGSIYVILPNNSRWLWHEKHYFEIPPRHFERWIVKPSGLRVVRSKHITSINWRAYLIGIRPLFRLITGKTTIKTFLRSLFAVKWTIYEIKKG